jgi:N-acetylglucosaminyl-diphospho-decaprenol L-rhamnosyltransferase
VTAVAVTYNSAASIDQCIRSLPVDIPLVVVDNDSADETLAVIRDVRPGAEVVGLETNVGFAAAVNVGIDRAGRDDDILLLNPDARLTAGSLPVLTTFLDGHPRCAVVSARIVDRGGRTEPVSAGREPTLGLVAADALGLGRSRQGGLYWPVPAGAPARRDWVAMTCVLIRRHALADVGPLDESYFLYCEDMDWCRRARARGWEVWVAPAATAVHERSASVGASGAWVDQHRIGSLDRYYAGPRRAAPVAAFRAVRSLGLVGRAVAFGTAGRLRADPALRAKGAQRWRDARLALGIGRR